MDGGVRALRELVRYCAADMLVHGIRHWAQLATVFRRSGQPQPWQHDLILGEGFGPPGIFVKEE
jgi:hypothetical protein